MQPLHEQYRPTSFDDVVGQDKAIARLRAIAQRGLGGRAYWFAGQSGTGKTTLARILASQIADPICIDEIDARECTMDYLRRIDRSMRMYGLGKGGRAYIVNEAHHLSAAALCKLDVLTEPLPDHVLFCFTTTNEGQETLFDGIDAKPFLSRCVRIPLARRDLCKPFAVRLKAIAEREGLDGQPVERYEKLLKSCGNNLREAFQEIESGAMIG